MKKLDDLTYNRKILWELDGQTYTARYKGLRFEIEDSGRNWLVIKSSGESLIIMLQDEVEALLNSLKEGLLAFELRERMRRAGSYVTQKFVTILEKLS